MKDFKYLEKFPKGWNEVKLSTYIELTHMLPAPQEVEDDEYQQEVFQIYFYMFTGINISDSNITSDEIVAIYTRLKFLDNIPLTGEYNPKLKSVDKLSYDDFITYQKLTESADGWLTNMAGIVKLFHIEEINEDDLTVDVAFNTFFLLKKKLKHRLSTHFRFSLGMKIIKQIVSQKWKAIKSKVKTSLTKTSAGSSSAKM